MLRHSLSLVTPPSSEPVTLAAAKEWLRLDTSDEDATITDLITSARQAAENYLRRSLISQTWKITFDLDCGGSGPWWDGVRDGAITSLYGGLPRILPLPKGPVASITSVTTYSLSNAASVLSPSNYRIDSSGDRLILNHGCVWPSDVRPQAGCEIVYVAGYGAGSDVPLPIKTGIMAHVSSLYEQRGQCDDPMPVAAERQYKMFRVMDFRG